MSKAFARVIYKQIYNFMENKVSKCVRGFRKSHGIHHSLIVMLEEWKKAFDKDENILVIFIITQRFLNSINHGPLLARHMVSQNKH